ncbi:Haloacid dehalogenase domain protein hydrolase [Chloroherpeton thalassium ATCC 35110]|uniref:phosphoglycolate phosphatase n=1 Tax=Chloroherpeton thalassium (strain ATCC 35110 / GB-78) TaxID=517418 RepID=B3QSF5_CHLT3|nr:HAD family hydrolase [Chloroherpeton thalassium]ACF12546.1 Haloacid dehalogenase domain protein hydrolase [Chloroherpeton thalassium ATCC 35110]
MNFSAVLFDLDGTLINTLGDIGNGVNAILRKNGFPEHDIPTYKNFIGDGVRELMSRALPDGVVDEDFITQCVAEFETYYQAHYDVETTLYPGIEDMLDHLAAKGVKFSVFSNKPYDLTHQCVKGILGKWTFLEVLGPKEGIPKKPNPYGAKRIIEKLAISPDQFLYLGDSGVDMKTATSVGMYPVGALWGFRTKEELLAAGAKKTVTHPSEVVRLF